MSFKSSELINDDSSLDASTVPTYEEFTKMTQSIFKFIFKIWHFD